MARMGKTVNSKLERLPWNDHVGCYGAHSSSFCKIWRPLDKAKGDTWRDVLLRNEQEEHWRSKHLKKNSSSSWYGPWRHQIIYFESRIERCWGKEESLVQQEYSFLFWWTTIIHFWDAKGIHGDIWILLQDEGRRAWRLCYCSRVAWRTARKVQLCKVQRNWRGLIQFFQEIESRISWKNC